MSDEMVREYVIEGVVKVNGAMGSSRCNGEHDGGDGNLTARGRRERSDEGGEDSGGGGRKDEGGEDTTRGTVLGQGRGRRGSPLDGHGVKKHSRNVGVCDHRRCRGCHRWWDRRRSEGGSKRWRKERKDGRRNG